LARPVIAPQFESRDPYWIVKRLSNRLGRGDGFIFQNAEERVEHDLLPFGVNLKDFSLQAGVVRLPERIDEGTAVRPVFPTPSGKIEFRSQLLIRQGQPAVPAFTPVPQPGPGFFRLLYGQSPVHSHTTTGNNPWLGHEMAENELWINDQEAKRLGFIHGEQVLLENQDGVWSPNPIRLKLTPGIRWDCVYTVHGFGSRSPLLHFGYNRGVADSSLMTRSLPDPVSGCRGLRVNFVRPVKKG
jgi:thiosulfate reductase/polysulfide reductase chain A